MLRDIAHAVLALAVMLGCTFLVGSFLLWLFPGWLSLLVACAIAVAFEVASKRRLRSKS